MPQDYNFWVYIMTNDHDTALYIGVTNDLARRISEHRAGEIPGFTANYRCKKLIYYEHAQTSATRLHGKSSSRNGREQRKWH